MDAVSCFTVHYADLSEAIQGYGPLKFATLLKQEKMMSLETLRNMEASQVPLGTQAFHILQSVEAQISYKGSGLRTFKTFIEVMNSTNYQLLVDLAAKMAEHLKYRIPSGRSDSMPAAETIKAEDPVIVPPLEADPISGQVVQAKPEGNSPNIEPYQMATYGNGVALVINNTRWTKTLENRIECEGDTNKVKRVLYHLNYRDVRPRKNLTHDRMIAEIKEAADEMTPEDCSFMLVLMSHGGEEGIYGADGETEEAKELDIDTIIEILTDHDNLIAKPKIILINSCRGGKAESPAIVGKPESGGRRFARDKSGKMYIPRCSDLYLSFSTLPGSIATRSEDMSIGGAVYIHYVCETFEKYAKTTQLNDMIMIVHNKMRQQLIKLDKKNFLQCGHVVHTMCQPFYFKPKHP